MALTEADNQYSLYLTSPEHQDKNHYLDQPILVKKYYLLRKRKK